MRARRDRLDARARVEAARGVLQQLETLAAFRAARSIAGYWACKGEVPLDQVLLKAGSRGQAWYLPRTLPQRGMVFARWAPGEPFRANRYGIPEPLPVAATIPATELDLVLVPLLAFDWYGSRLGMGGGYYDRCFAFRRRNTSTRPLLVGVAYGFQQVVRLQPAPWDVTLDLAVTERELITCKPEESFS